MKNINLPTRLTLFRIAAVPLVVILLLEPSPFTAVITAIVFGAAAFTDFLDGYLARSTGTVTPIGKLLDPMADKLLIISALIPLVGLDRIPVWFAVIMLAREFAVTSLRMVAATENRVMAAGQKGKYKTGFEIAAMEFLILQWDIGVVHFQTVGMTLLTLGLFFSLWGAWDYFNDYFFGKE